MLKVCRIEPARLPALVHSEAMEATLLCHKANEHIKAKLNKMQCRSKFVAVSMPNFLPQNNRTAPATPGTGA